MTHSGLVIQQVYYGSETGRGNFQNLAASEGLQREELLAVERFSNLGGSALKGKNPKPIHAFYALGGNSQNLAYAKTDFPDRGRGARGNDYLVHVLIFSPETLHRLRGDVFLLDDFFKTTVRPQRGDRLAPLILPISREERSKVPGVPLAIEGAQRRVLEDLIDALSQHNTVCLEVEDTQNALALCRSLFRTLPPDDRLKLYFCTHYSFDRRLPFRFSLYTSKDRDSIKHIGGAHQLTPLTATNPGRPPAGQGATLWLDQSASGIEPIFGLSPLTQGVGAAQALQLAHQTTDWLNSERWAPCPIDDAQNQTIRPLLLKMGRDMLNRPLARLGQLFPLALFESFADRVSAHLGQGSEAPNLIQKDAIAIYNVLSDQAQDQHQLIIRRFRARSLAQRTAAGLALLLHAPHQIHPDAILHSEKPALFSDPADAASALHILYDASPAVFNALITLWLETWRNHSLQEGLGPRRTWDFSTWKTIVKALAQHKPALSAEMFVRLLCGAAPNTETHPAERRTWFLTLLGDVRPAIRTIFSRKIQAQVVITEDLFHKLDHKTLQELTLFIVKHPAPAIRDLLEQRFEQIGDRDLHILTFFMASASDLLFRRTKAFPRGRKLTSDHWAIVLQLAQIATRALTLHPKEDVHPNLLKDTFSLVWLGCQTIALERTRGRDVENYRVIHELAKLLNQFIMHWPDRIDPNHVMHMLAHIQSADLPVEVIKDIINWLKDPNLRKIRRQQSPNSFKHFIDGLREARVLSTKRAKLAQNKD